MRSIIRVTRNINRFINKNNRVLHNNNIRLYHKNILLLNNDDNEKIEGTGYDAYKNEKKKNFKKNLKYVALFGGLYLLYKGEVEDNLKSMKQLYEEYRKDEQKLEEAADGGLLQRTSFADLKKLNNYDIADEGGYNTGLSKEHFVEVKLKNVVQYNHDSNIYQFELAGGDEAEVFLGPGSFVLFNAKIDGKHVQRPYTPINTAYSRTLDFLIKKYPNGKMSQYLASLKPGDTIYVRGPLVKPKIYPSKGDWDLAMIAGGTGITPMLQLMYHRVGNGLRMGPDADHSRLTLVYANKTYNDILLRDWLDKLAGQFSPEHGLRLVHVLEEAPKESGDKGRDMVSYEGHVNTEMLKEVLPKPSSKTRIYVCGPPPMMKAVCGPKGKKGSQGELDGMLKELGYTKDMVYKI